MTENFDYSFFNYPVYYQQQNGYLVFHCPDLHIIVTTTLPYKDRFDSKYSTKLVKTMLKMEVKIRERVKNMKKARIKLPTPSSIKNTIKDTKVKKLTAPQVAQILDKSVNTVRRWADEGRIPCEVSEGGTRYFLEKDLVDFI
jgi:hypothetical protein